MSATIKIMVRVVYDSDELNSTTTSTSTVNCSPRWIVYHNRSSQHGVQNTSATTQQQCLDSCVASSTCVSVSWFWSDKPPSCWMHTTHYPHHYFSGKTLFEIVRQCYLTSGEWRQQVLFCSNVGSWFDYHWLAVEFYYSNPKNNEYLRFHRETALQGGLVMAKSGRLELWDNIYGHYTCRSVFNHCDVMGQQSNRIRWKKRKVKAITPLKVIQGHRGRYQSKAGMQLPISD